MPSQEVEWVAGHLEVLAALSEVMVEQERPAQLLLAGLLAGGHVLIEDVPGVGKTTLARSMARLLGCEFKRLQLTPDLLPADITGFNVYNPKTGEFAFRPGPVLTNVLLADELNRATPRTQAALLEAMEERQVTVEGATIALPSPFMVIATQNPVETAGTFPLPEAQLDRFMLRIKLGYPSLAGEITMLRRLGGGQLGADLPALLDPRAVVDMQGCARSVFIAPPVLEYIARVCRATRDDSGVSLGASPRASRDLMRAAQAFAFVSGRDYVTPDDVRELAVPVLAHRIIPRYGGSPGAAAGEQVVLKALASCPAPTEPIGVDGER